MPAKRSAYELARGDRTGALTIGVRLPQKTSPNAVVNVLSRSRIKNRKLPARPPRSISRLRAGETPLNLQHSTLWVPIIHPCRSGGMQVLVEDAAAPGSEFPSGTWAIGGDKAMSERWRAVRVCRSPVALVVRR